MGISPMYVGQTQPLMALTIQQDSGAALNLSGGMLAMTLRNRATGQNTAAAGLWAITNATAGQATYTWAAADTAQAGQYDLYISVTFPGGVVTCDPLPWLVLST